MAKETKAAALQEVAWTYDSVRKEIRSATNLSSADAREDAKTINAELHAQFGDMAGPQGMFASVDRHTVIVKRVLPEEFEEATGVRVSDAPQRGGAYHG